MSAPPAWRQRSGGEVWALWADLDTLDAHHALEQLPVTPAILIASGTVGHLHAYFPLREPVSILAAEAANRRLAAQLGADTAAVTNAATILRPLSVGARYGRGDMPACSLEDASSSGRGDRR